MSHYNEGNNRRRDTINESYITSTFNIAKIQEARESPKWEAPEKDLLVAILERAILDFLYETGTLYQDTKEWFEDEFEESEAPITSYVFICNLLRIDRVRLVDRLVKTKASGVQFKRRKAKAVPLV